MKDKKKVISFPHMGNYYVPVKYLLSHVFHCKILVAPKITSRTIELGTKYSPDFVCTPFKYTLGTLIESLENGANILLQAGGGCKYGYYSELQIEILKNLGYQFEYVNLVSKGKMNMRRMYHMVKKIDPEFQIVKFLKYARIVKRMVIYMDHFEDEVRKRIGFEKEEGSFENRKNFPKEWAGLRDEKLQEITGVKTAAFCHIACFICTAKTKDDAIKLANIARKNKKE